MSVDPVDEARARIFDEWMEIICNGPGLAMSLPTLYG